MGRSEGKNKTANILIGSGNASFGGPRLSKKPKVELDDLTADNLRQALVPNQVSNNQIGVTIYWESERANILDFLYDDSEVAKTKTNPDVIYDLEDGVHRRDNLLDWAHYADMASIMKISYPGDKMTAMPKSDSHGLFLSTVLDFDPNNLDEGILDSLNQEAKDVLFSNLEIEEKLNQLKGLIYPSRFSEILAKMVKPLDGDPLKIAFRKNN